MFGDYIDRAILRCSFDGGASENYGVKYINIGF
jgi:hypothetical protein